MSSTPWTKPKPGNLTALFGPGGFKVQAPAPRPAPEDEFLEAMQSHGLTPDGITADGSLHRFSTNGKRGDDSGWYVLHNGGIPAGAFGDWRTDLTVTWSSVDGTADAEMLERLRVQIQAAKREREAERARQQQAAEQQASDILKTAVQATQGHPYLKAKGVKPHGLSVDTEGRLLVPMMDEEGVVRSLQRIGPDGQKRFLSGGRKKGCYWIIGNPGTSLYVAEGFATAATIHEVTGEAVAVAFDAGNLLPVCKALKARWPHLPLTIAADNDRNTQGNPGVTKATEAASQVHAQVLVPNFSSDEGSDWNDLAQAEGIEVVREQLQVKAQEGNPARFHFQAVEDLVAQPPPRWLVRGVVEEQGIGVFFGAPGSGKTFAALDVCLAVVQGNRWMGRRVRPAVVVYVAAEGSLKMRVRAYLMHHHIAPADLWRFRVLESSVNLLNPGADLVDLIAGIRVIEETVGAIGLVVIDTLNRVMPGGNENTAEDMGAAVSSADRIRREFGCFVLFVHHSGKDESKGSRGHSSLLGAVDAELQMRRDSHTNVRTAIAVKVREEEDNIVLGAFTLRVVDLGPVSSVDPDADDDERFTSCVLEPAEIPDAPRQRLSDREQLALSYLHRALDSGAQIVPFEVRKRAGKKAPKEGQTGCLVDDWRDHAISAGGLTDSDSPATHRKVFHRQREKLEKIDFIAVLDGWVWLRDSRDTSATV